MGVRSSRGRATRMDRLGAPLRVHVQPPSSAALRRKAELVASVNHR